MKKIRKQAIKEIEDNNSIRGKKAKIMLPLLFLSLVLVLSFAVNDVSAANVTSNNTITQANNVAVPITAKITDSQSTVQSTAKTIKQTNSTSKSLTTNKTTTTTTTTTLTTSSSSSKSLNTNKKQTVPDPQIYRNGAPVARGGNPAGYVYPDIASAITVANAGDTIMLENGSTFQEHGLVINKDLNFDVFSNGHATIDGQNLGAIFIINNGVTVTLNNLILENGQGTSGGAIYNNGTLTVNNCTFQNNTATQNGGAIYNDGSLNYNAATHTSETVTENGGILTVNNSTFTGNKAVNGGAIYNAGDINITNSSTLTDFTITQNGGTLNVVDSIFANNTATQNGGAIANDATFNVDASTLTRTVITQNGGVATISGSTFTGNSANNGGAISNLATFNTSGFSTLTGTATTGTTALNSGTVTVTDSSIIDNTANINGGAIYNGAITSATNTTFTDYTVNNDATLTAKFNTMAGNSALNGGAIYNDAVSTVTQNTLTRTTLNNDAAATTTDNALVGNSATNGRDIVNNQVLTANNNVITVSAINNTGTVDAMRNWWGYVTGPAPGDVVGTVDTSNFLNYTMGITVTSSNSSPNVGQQYQYTIIVTNNGPDDATDVQVTDGIPDGITYNSSTTSQGTYDPSTDIWNVGTLASGASAALQIFVTPTNSVAGTLVTKNATLINNNETGSATVSIPSAPVSVVLTKTASNLTPNVGQQFNYAVTATNNGSGTASGVQVTDQIPAGLTFNSYTASQGTYDNTTGIWNVGTLTSGASAVLQLFVTPTASVAGTTVNNTATTLGQNASATVVVQTTPVSNVTLTKTASNLTPNVGQQFNYAVTATNNGPDTANGINVTDQIPAGLTFNSYTASQGTYDSTTGIWNVGTLLNGASAVLQLFVTPTASVAGTTVTNTATSIGQTVNAAVVVPATSAAVVLTKTASNLAPNVDQQFHYVVTATNNGPGTASGVQVTDHIPAGLTFNSYTASQGTYDSTTGIWNVGTLLNGASAVLQLFVTPTASVAGTTVTNTATSIGQIVTAAVVVPTTPVSNVTLTKTASNLAPNVGQQFNYAVTATNNGSGTASGVNVTDQIPAGLTFNSYTASQGTYDSTTGIWNVGTLTSGASAVLQLFVTPTASVAGTTVTNTATSIGQIVTAAVVVPKTVVSNVTLTKTASNLAPNVGQDFYYTITATNNGPKTTTGVQVTDLLPAGLTYKCYQATKGTYNNVTGIWNVGTLLKGTSATLYILVTPTASAGTTITNTATTIGQIVTATVVVSKNIVSNVTLTKTASNLTPNVGQDFYYTITATNNGPDTATGVQVLDKIPAGLTFKCYQATQGTYNSVTGIWNVGTLAMCKNAVLYLLVTPNACLAGKSVTNTATVVNTTQTACATVHVPMANVVLTKTASNLTPCVGQDFYYTITVTNNGPDTATGVQVTDLLPAGLTYKCYQATQGTYNSATGIWNLGTLRNGGCATLYILVTPTSCVAGKTVTNTAKVTAQNEYNTIMCPSATKTVCVKPQKPC